MIKKLLLLAPLLLLSSCNDLVIYDNVSYEYNFTKQNYSVACYGKSWVIGIDDVHCVFVSQYPPTSIGDGHVALNQFYVKGKSYNLYVYKLK